jgi:steroid 5-alpha reductase family enzyme
MIATFVVAWLTLLAGGTVAWAFALRHRDVSFVDVSWGPAFVLAAWIFHARSPVALEPVHAVLLGMVTVWGSRLALHIGVRRRGQGEDRRYREMRQRTGTSFGWRSLFEVFWLQATLAALLALPFLLVLSAADPNGWGSPETAGMALWTAGLLYEAVADLQLLRFQRDPANRGKVMDRGLWRTSRHPNYFGEAVLWWGWAVFALGTPAGLWGALSAFAMTVLLVRVSGVPLVERGAEARRPGYADYVGRTSSFVPRPRRAAAGEGTR